MAQNQRERLFGAMVANVSQRGYVATRVTDLVELSGVSRRSFYDLYPDKRACFQATIEAMLSAGIELALAAESRGSTWEEKAINRFQAFARVVAAQPAAASMCLIEAYAAGPEVLCPVEDAIATLERMTQQRFRDSPARAKTPPELITAFVGATIEMARTRLHEGRQAEFPAEIPRLMELLLAYRPPSEPLRLATRQPTPAPETIEAHDHSERAVRALATVAAERGYAATTINQVVKRASMSPTTFYANFSGKDDALFAAIDSAAAQTAAAVLPAFRRSTDWPHGVRAAFGALLSFLASRPTLARLVLVEVYAAGADAVAHRREAMRPLESIFFEGRAFAPEMSPFMIEAITGAVSSLAYKQICRSGAESLPSIAPACTYMTLAPFIGAEQAAEVANGDGRARGTRGEEMSYRVLLSKLHWMFHERTASAEEISRQLEQPVEKVRRAIEELVAAEMLEIAEETAGKDGVEAFYRAHKTLIEDDRWRQLSKAEREEISAGIANMITGEIDHSIETGAFDARFDRYLIRNPVSVDEQGWRELAEIHDAAFRASLAAQERSAQRLRSSGETAIEARSVQVLFELPKR